MLRPTAVVLAGISIACSPELLVPQNVLVRCDEGVCPDGYHCNNASLCVPSSSPDSTAPTVTNATYDRIAVGKSGTISLSFVASEALLVDPRVTFASGGASHAFVRVSATEGELPSYVFAYTPDGSESEGTFSVEADLIDRAGNGNVIALPTLAIDFTPPEIVANSTLLELVPERAKNALENVSAITNGTRVRLSFATRETLSTPPALQVGDTTMAMTPVSATVFSLDVVWSSALGVPDGVYDVTTLLQDDAGNEARVQLALLAPATPRGFVVDTVAPAAPVMDGVTVVRTPWGTVEAPAYGTRVVGRAGSVEPDAHIAAYAGADNTFCEAPSCRFAAQALSVATGDASGAFELSLGGADREDVFISVIDNAGNASGNGLAGLRATRVADITLDIALDEPGVLENDNEIAIADSFPSYLDVPANGAERSTVTRADGTGPTSTGSFTWRSHDTPAPAVRGQSAWSAPLPSRGLVLTHLVSWMGSSGYSVSNLVRDATGFRAVSAPPATSVSDAVAVAYSIANDAALVVVGNTTWLYDGMSWRQVCRDSGCSASSPRRNDFALVADPNRRVVTLLGGTASSGDAAGFVWEWDGSRWTNRCGAGCNAPELGANPAAFFDPKLNSIVVLPSRASPASMFTWNGTTFTRHCDGCVLPPAREGPAVAYDIDRSEAVLFGGATTTDCLYGDIERNDTWTWNGSVWTQRSPATSPPAARDAALVFDPHRRRIVMAGGRTVQCGYSDYTSTSDTWEWDGTTWLAVRIVNALPPRLGFDPLAKRVTAIADIAGIASTVRWNGFEWYGTTIAAPTPASSSLRLEMTQVDASGRLVLLSGTNAYVLGSVWSALCSGAGCGLGTADTFVTTSDGLIAIDTTASAVRRLNGSAFTTLCTGCAPSASFQFFIGAESPRFYKVDSGLHVFNGTTFQLLSTASYGDQRRASGYYDYARHAPVRLGGARPGSRGSWDYNQPVATHFVDGAWRGAPLSIASEDAPDLLDPVVTYDVGRGEAVIQTLTTTWTFGSANDRPAHLVTLPLRESVSADATLTALDIDWYGNATSDVNGGASDDAIVWIWDVDHWTDTRAAFLGDHMHAHITSATFGVNGRLARTLVGEQRTVTVAITPAGTNGRLPGNATLYTDAVAGKLSYSLAR